MTSPKSKSVVEQTATEYIQERLEALKGLDSPAPTRGLDLFEREMIAELERILDLIQKRDAEQRKEIAKKLKDDVWGEKNMGWETYVLIPKPKFMKFLESLASEKEQEGVKE